MSMIPTCTTATHDLMRAHVSLFEASTMNRKEWDGVVLGECRNCGSTLGLPICFLCPKPCSARDANPWGDGVAHFACISKLALSTAETRFVIVVGGGKAREFVRGGDSS